MKRKTNHDDENSSDALVKLPDNPDIDQLSRRIVRLLQEDGRRSFTSIARELGVSESAIRTRVGNLEKNEHLRFIAVIDPVQAGYGSWAMLGIRVSSGASPEKLGLQFSKLRGAIWVGIVGGRYDLMVEVWLSDSAMLHEFLEQNCFSNDDVASVETMIGMRIQKWGAPGL